jgi:hypothetical protein
MPTERLSNNRQFGYESTIERRRKNMTVTWITRSMAIVGMVCASALTGCAPADEEASDAAPTEEAAPTEADGDGDAEAEE